MALGLSLPGTILFASSVLLVEGDTEPVLLGAVLQRMVERGELDIDLNSLAIVSTGDSLHADALVRILEETTGKPRLALLFDGDRGGADRRKALKELIKNRQLPEHTLANGATIEDYLIDPREFVAAAASYAADVAGGDGTAFSAKLVGEYDAESRGSQTTGLYAWLDAKLQSEFPEKGRVSKLGVAREYVARLPDSTAETPKRLRELGDWVAAKLELDKTTADTGAIV
jgi:hypothetical protein